MPLVQYLIPAAIKTAVTLIKILTIVTARILNIIRVPVLRRLRIAGGKSLKSWSASGFPKKRPGCLRVAPREKFHPYTEAMSHMNRKALPGVKAMGAEKVPSVRRGVPERKGFLGQKEFQGRKVPGVLKEQPEWKEVILSALPKSRHFPPEQPMQQNPRPTSLLHLHRLCQPALSCRA
jgi:hypothetical protein